MTVTRLSVQFMWHVANHVALCYERCENHVLSHYARLLVSFGQALCCRNAHIGVSLTCAASSRGRAGWRGERGVARRGLTCLLLAANSVCLRGLVCAGSIFPPSLRSADRSIACTLLKSAVRREPRWQRIQPFFSDKCRNFPLN